MSNIKLFEDRKVRSVWSEQEQKWYFSIDDIVEVLAEPKDVKDYIKKLKLRDFELNSNWGTICHLVEMVARDGKKRKVSAANVEGILRLVQSIPSKKAEPFKLWLAKVGYERLEEIENPELANARMKSIYKQKGYSDEWIEKRIRGIQVRDELTDEWKKRGVKEGREYAILTAEISMATFGMTPSNYREYKGLGETKANLRDHMDDLELIFTMLGEASTARIARGLNAQGLKENTFVAKKGGAIAGDARRQLELDSGQPVSTHENYLTEAESAKRQRLNKRPTDLPNDNEE